MSTSRRISDAAAALKSALSSRNLRRDEALIAIRELKNLTRMASELGSLNQLKRINQAIKESTRGIINLIDSHGDFGLVSTFINRSWLKPYAQKNLNYLKHTFTNDLGI